MNSRWLCRARLMDKDASGAGGAPTDTPPTDGKDLFSTGYGKGAEKGRSEVLSILGASSLDEVKAIKQRMDASAEAERKALAEQGKFKELFEAEQKRASALESKLGDATARLTAFEVAQKADYDALLAKVPEPKRALLTDDIPLPVRIRLAREFAEGAAGSPAGGANGAVGGRVGGTTPRSAADAQKRLDELTRKGIWNLTAEERVEADALDRQISGQTFGEYARQHTARP